MKSVAIVKPAKNSVCSERAESRWETSQQGPPGWAGCSGIGFLWFFFTKQQWLGVSLSRLTKAKPFIFPQFVEPVVKVSVA